MWHRIYRVVFLAVVLSALVACSAQGRLIQRESLEATSRVQSWQSIQFPANAMVFVRVYYQGAELIQRGGGGCTAGYVGHGIAIIVRLLNCRAPGRGSYVFRFVSLTQPKYFTVKMTVFG